MYLPTAPMLGLGAVHLFGNEQEPSIHEEGLSNETK
jgi:hypothetical protein